MTARLSMTEGSGALWAIAIAGVMPRRARQGGWGSGIGTEFLLVIAAAANADPA